jgi:catechol 2,3-dioxygenase-like lactoylglutathione lyase family enzyme
MEVLASRLILHPGDLTRSRHFYETILGLRVFHEYGNSGRIIGVVYFLGGGFLELSGARSTTANGFSKLWIQVPDVRGEEQRLRGLGQPIREPTSRKPWGLIELCVIDPDGHEVLLVEVPEDHFLRRQL